MIVTNKQNIPKGLVAALTPYQRKIVPGRYSVTEVVNAPLVAVLRRRHGDEITVDVSERIWAMFGTAVHMAIEKSQEDEQKPGGIRRIVPGRRRIARKKKSRSRFKRLKSGTLTEQYVETKLKGVIQNVDVEYTVRGVFDEYDFEDKTLRDYKTTSVNSVIFGGRDEWTAQLNMYAFMARMQGLEVNHLENVLILRDWMQTKARTQSDYPQSQIFVMKQPVWTDAACGMYLSDRVWNLIHMEDVPDALQTPCNAVDRWARPDTYAVMKNKNKRATRVLSSKAEAEAYATGLAAKTTKDKYYIIKRPGRDVRCEDYCEVNPFCPYWQKRLTMNINGDTIKEPGEVPEK